MAQLPVRYSGVIVDGIQAPVSVTSYLALPDTATISQVNAALGVWAQAVDGVIDGAFLQVAAVIGPPLPGGLKPATGATWAASKIGETGIINFSATGTNMRWGQALPTLSQSVRNGGQIDPTNTAILALIALLTNPTGFFTNDTQQSLEAALDALITFRQRSIVRKRSTELFP